MLVNFCLKSVQTGDGLPPVALGVLLNQRLAQPWHEPLRPLHPEDENVRGLRCPLALMLKL